MACMQEIKASCESDHSEKAKTVSKGPQGYQSSEHAKHDHKSVAYSSQGGGYQAVGAQISNPASANKHHIMGGLTNKHSNNSGQPVGHVSLTEKVTGLFSSSKKHQSSGCNTHGSHGHQTSAHGSHDHQANQALAHGSQAHPTTANGTHITSGHGYQNSAHGNHGHQDNQALAHGSQAHPTTGHGTHITSGHGYQPSAHGSHGHPANQALACSQAYQTTACGTHVTSGHGTHNTGGHCHNSSGCNHGHHKAISQETYVFKEKKKEYTSCKSGQTKVEKKVKKKSSYKSSNSDSGSDKEHC